MPSPLKKIQERLIPDGTIANLRLTRVSLSSGDKYESTLAVEMEVMDGEYAGEPVSDYLNIQESQKNPGQLYISKKGKLYQVIRNSLTKHEFNALSDELAPVEEDRDAWLEKIAGALNDADYPIFRSVVVQNEPEDEANKRNKLTKEPAQIGPYMDPSEAEEVYQKVHGFRNAQKAAAEAANTAEIAELSDEEEQKMEEALG